MPDERNDGKRPGRRATLAAALAANVRGHREAAGLSLTELAELSGIAKGTISAIESGRGNPTVDTTYAIAAALGCPMSDLLADAPDPMLVAVRGDAPSERIGVVQGRLLQRFTPTGPVEVYAIELGGTRARHSPAHAEGVYEHVWAARGSAEVGPIDDVHRLDEGDYVCFEGWHEHRYRAIAAPARLLLLLSYVRAVSAVPVLRHLGEPGP